LSPDTFLPLLAQRDLDQPLAWRAGTPVSAREFLADVARFAPALLPGGPVVNLCVDRYAFAVALAAALVRGEASLLPPDARPDTLARLHEIGDPAYAVIDDPALETPGLPRVQVEDRAPTVDGPEPPLPSFAAGMHAVSLLT